MVPCNCSKCNRKIVDVHYGNPLPEDNPVSSDEDSDNKEIPPELFITDEKSSETDEESNESEINNGDNNDYEYTEIFENYAPPVYEQFQNRISPDTNANRQFLRLKQCQTPLAERSTLLHGCIKIRSEKIFPFASIRNQLASIDKNLVKFFRPEVADSNLGLMLNLDWFQPYNGIIHSTRVIYAAICNLPRDMRFKRENMLVLVLLWDGVTFDNTFEYQKSRKIQAALILISCDIPAARKICGHISALSSCYRCEKKANYENHKHNFAGMDNMSEWFINRDLA
ncbi:hypothetical protein RhiirB3_454854 [Rhizophagus irregularis]|nr:hypothetical protein RhiirB3_454854 [Rhizophagus irregularis]